MELIMADFSESEKQIENLFVIGSDVDFQGQTYNVALVGKPRPTSGESKTDIYILLNNQYESREIKISYKKDNADFLENKISAERAEQLFGNNWQSIIQRSIKEIRTKFESRSLIYKSKSWKTEKGSVTLGWKFELMNKLSGELSNEIILSPQQHLDVLGGNNLSEDKKNARVSGQVVANSGVANFILIGSNFKKVEDVLNQLQPIESYIAHNPKIYFACKALNYRTTKSKYDGNRPLAVQVDWSIQEGKLTPKLIFDRPLTFKGRDVAEKLSACLRELDIKSTDDINENNCLMRYVHE